MILSADIMFTTVFRGKENVIDEKQYQNSVEKTWFVYIFLGRKNDDEHIQHSKSFVLPPNLNFWFLAYILLLR